VKVAVCVEEASNCPTYVVGAMEVDSELFAAEFIENWCQSQVEGALRTFVLPGSVIQTFRQGAGFNRKNSLIDLEDADWDLSTVEGMSWTHEWPQDPYTPEYPHRRLLYFLKMIYESWRLEPGRSDTELQKDFGRCGACVNSQDRKDTARETSVWVNIIGAIASQYADNRDTTPIDESEKSDDSDKN